MTPPHPVCGEGTAESPRRAGRRCFGSMLPTRAGNIRRRRLAVGAGGGVRDGVGDGVRLLDHGRGGRDRRRWCWRGLHRGNEPLQLLDERIIRALCRELFRELAQTRERVGRWFLWMPISRLMSDSDNI